MTAQPTYHIGKKIERIRILLGVKQEVLAASLGVSQSTVSKWEQSEELEEDKLEKIATVLGVSIEAIKDFSEEAVINIISSTLNDNAGSVNYNCSLHFNPIEKIVELYERMLKDRDQLIEAYKAIKN